MLLLLMLQTMLVYDVDPILRSLDDPPCIYEFGVQPVLFPKFNFFYDYTCQYSCK